MAHNIADGDEESTFRALLEAAPDGIILVERTGRISVANSMCAKLFGYEPAELIDELVEIIVPEYVRSKHGPMRDAFFADPRSRPMGIGLELVAARKDGTQLPVEISLSPVRIAGRDAAIAVIRDVTEQRRLDRDLKRFNRELTRSNSELEQFAYVASHDLQEPLRMVSGYTQLLKRRYQGKLDKEADEYIDFAVDGVKRMQSLINDLLAFSRVSSRGKAFETVDLRDVTEQARANLQASLAETRALLDVGPMPVIYGDRTQLVQLFQNLIGNAVKFHRLGVAPDIKVVAARDGEQWSFSVTDDGIGIETEYYEKVFVIFQRLHSREKYSGTGIGLAICKKIVERHGGRIWIDSVPDQGTTFHFTIASKETSS